MKNRWGYGYLATDFVHLASTKKSEKNRESSQKNALSDGIKIGKSHFWVQL